MSYGLMGYQVDIEELKAFRNCNDEQLFDDLVDRFGYDMRQTDAQLSFLIDEGGPTVEEALRSILFDDEPQDGWGWGAQYAYAFEVLCEWSGDFLDNHHLYPLGDADSLNEALEEMGVESVDFYDLQFGGLPVRLPRPDDFPATGYLTADRVSRANDEFASADSPPNDWRADSIGNLAKWLRTASANGLGIVSFYY